MELKGNSSRGAGWNERCSLAASEAGRNVGRWGADKGAWQVLFSDGATTRVNYRLKSRYRQQGDPFAPFPAMPSSCSGGWVQGAGWVGLINPRPQPGHRAATG